MSSTMKMLYGPPGTGKTWLAAREAVKAIEPKAFAEAANAGSTDEAVQSLHRSLVNEGRILWVTFHANYSYEDFVEGYRPVVDKGVMTYKVIDGPFKNLCERARWKKDLEVGDWLEDRGGGESAEVVEVDSSGWLLRIRPGRRDQVAEYYDKFVSRKVIERLLAAGFPPSIFSISGKGDYEVASFGIDPNAADVMPLKQNPADTALTGPNLRRVLAARTGVLSSSDLSNNAVYGHLMSRLSAMRQSATPGKPVALVIDEFNRADPSRVFGELLTLLESDKREGLPEERRVLLPYSQSVFSVPQQVSVIGTMNTVDKSLAPVDFAMRRRFRFEYVGAAPELLDQAYGAIDLQALLRRINSRLSSLLGTGHEVGHAFLLSAKLDEISSRMGWIPYADCPVRAIAYVLRTNILPTIAEYFHDDWRKVRAVMAQTLVEGKDVSLLDIPDVEEKFIERLPEDYELIDGRTAYYAGWWNPEHRDWDGVRVSKFLASLAAGA